MNVAICDLRERPEFFDVVADRIWRAWWEPNGFSLPSVVDRLRENLIGPGIPVALVAHRGGAFLGTVSLIEADLEQRPQYAPWIAALWTEPQVRKNSIGRRLVEAAFVEALKLGREPVYLCARPAMRNYYLNLGWSALEDAVGRGQMTVFVRRRSLDAMGPP